MRRWQIVPRSRSLTLHVLSAALVLGVVSVVALVRASDQPIDLDQNATNGAESRVTTRVLQTYPVRVENTVHNNASGTSYSFKWDGAGPGGFSSSVTAGPGVGTMWVWSTAYQVYSIQSPVSFTPVRTLPVIGAPSGGIRVTGGVTSFMAPGKSIFPTSVTLSDSSLSSSLITFFSPEKTVASCGFQCAPGECELFLENHSGGTATLATRQLGCCPEPHQLICDGTCQSYLTDVNNCGGCGNVCAADEICTDGACACPGGLTQCGSGCLDLQTDPLNCGACANVCAEDETCSAGSCACDTGLTQCGAGCLDLQTDPLNCGACGNVCPVGGTCAGGSCVCPAGQTACGGACVDLTSDPLNCGACGNVCGSNSICSAGSCRACRPPRQTACGNQCVNIHTDPLNCGGCGNVCDFSGCPSEGQGTCSQGSSCVCSPLSGSGSTEIRFKPEPKTSQPRVSSQSQVTSQTAIRPVPRAAAPLLRRSPAVTSSTAAAVTGSRALSAPNVLDVQEAPVCDLAPIEQTLPPGGVFTQSQTGGRFGKEILSTVAISVNGQTIAEGPCPQVVPVTDVDTSGVILSATAVATRDSSGDGLCQPGESLCEYFITAADLGDAPCINPEATLTSPPDEFNPNPITFLTATSAYPNFPAYPGVGQPLVKLTNATAFAITTPPDQPSDVGRPFLMSVTCSNRPETVVMPIVLGIGNACDPSAPPDGETYDRLDGFQAPVKARLVAKGNPVNYSTGNFNLGSTIPLKIALSCGSRALSDAEIEPNPEIVTLLHETLGPQPLMGINGDNNANQDDPLFSCSGTGCEYQFRTEVLPAGRYIMGIRMPDSRIFEAGFTISP